MTIHDKINIIARAQIKILDMLLLLSQDKLFELEGNISRLDEEEFFKKRKYEKIVREIIKELADIAG